MHHIDIGWPSVSVSDARPSCCPYGHTRKGTTMSIDIDAMTRGFLECALWTATCNGQAEHDDCRGEDCDAGLDGLGYEVFSFSTYDHEQARQLCADFVTLVQSFQRDILDDLDPAQVGHDFWLTSQHHGAGFWDRGLGDRGDLLTKWSQTFSFESPYVGDDKEIHFDY